MLHPVKLTAHAILMAMTLFVVGCSDTPEPAETPEQQDAMSESSRPAGEKAPNWRLSLTKPELMTFAQDENIFWHINTNVGAMKFRLFHDTAPMHTTSTIYLTEQGFYDNLSFHRVIPGFMAQGGDPIGNGTGNPGYKYDGEFTGGRSHDKPGILSMANAGPGTDGSQFFITFVPTTFLDGKHTIFGEIVEGESVLGELAARGSRSGKTSEPLMIVKATISRE